jgi:maleate cis-trans isomerase
LIYASVAGVIVAVVDILLYSCAHGQLQVGLQTQQAYSNKQHQRKGVAVAQLE